MGAITPASCTPLGMTKNALKKICLHRAIEVGVVGKCEHFWEPGEIERLAEEYCENLFRLADLQQRIGENLRTALCS